MKGGNAWILKGVDLSKARQWLWRGQQSRVLCLSIDVPGCCTDMCCIIQSCILDALSVEKDGPVSAAGCLPIRPMYRRHGV